MLGFRDRFLLSQGAKTTVCVATLESLPGVIAKSVAGTVIACAFTVNRRRAAALIAARGVAAHHRGAAGLSELGSSSSDPGRC